MAGAEPYVPENATLGELREAAQDCKGCDLYLNATQAVLGEGPAHAAIVMVGEQPGDREDLAGRPFVGPAGAMLEKALADVGLSREDVYLTNVVKHFYFEERGKVRIHKKPRAGHVKACRLWLEACVEIQARRHTTRSSHVLRLFAAMASLAIIKSRRDDPSHRAPCRTGPRRRHWLEGLVAHRAQTVAGWNSSVLPSGSLHSICVRPPGWTFSWYGIPSRSSVAFIAS